MEHYKFRYDLKSMKKHGELDVTLIAILLLYFAMPLIEFYIRS